MVFFFQTPCLVASAANFCEDFGEVVVKANDAKSTILCPQRAWFRKGEYIDMIYVSHMNIYIYKYT